MARKKINKLLIGTAICSSLFCFGLQAKEIDTNIAQMQAMDKITGKVSVIDVPVNGDVKFGSFSIVVRACKTRPPEETPENFAFVDVVDNYDGDKPVNIFRGWMMSSTPGLNAVEHPIYDVWLLKCMDGKVDRSKLLSAEKLKERDWVEKAPNIEEQKDQNSIQEQKSEEKASEVIEQVPVATSTVGLPSETDIVLPVSDTVASDVVLPPAVDHKVEEAPILQPNIDDVVEDGAPKSLLSIGSFNQPTESEPQNIDNLVVTTENPEIASEKTELSEEVIINNDNQASETVLAPVEPMRSELVDDGSVVSNNQGELLQEDQTMQTVSPPAPLIGEDSMMTDVVGKPQEENQLINFEEVEEEVLDMPSEAISE